MRRIKVTLAAVGVVGALGVLAPGAGAQGTTTAPGQQCPSTATHQSNAMEAPRNGGQSSQHMGSGHGPGGMSKAQPFCMMDMQ